jgi:hypothetical protein
LAGLVNHISTSPSGGWPDQLPEQKTYPPSTQTATLVAALSWGDKPQCSIWAAFKDAIRLAGVSFSGLNELVILISFKINFYF